MKVTPPCKDCINRYVGCHSSCEEYQSFRISLNEYNDNLYKERYKDNLFNSFKKEVVRKTKKKK